MRELELNAIFSIVPDPEVNKVNVSNRKMRQEIERMVRIFEITNAQKVAHGGLAIKNLSSFELVKANDVN